MNYRFEDGSVQSTLLMIAGILAEHSTTNKIYEQIDEFK